MLDIIASPFVLEDIEKLHQAKATSIILGTPFFSVRAVSAFSKEEIKEAKALCAQYGMQCLVLVNRFFVEKELDVLREFLAFLKEVDVDGIYFTDMGVLQEARTLGIAHKMIYNPDTILTNANDIQAYLDLGIKMCTIAKEITLEDMVQIGNKVQGELEVIVHGRLNMMHSKRNLLTNYMTFLNKEETLRNRKDLYLTEEHREEKMPIIEDEEGTHIFTGFTLCSFEELEDITNANIKHIRIESMFSNIVEVCQIIEDYRYVHEYPAKGREMYQKYENTFTDQNITKGFLYKKTGLLK